MSINATFGGAQLNDLEHWTLSASSSPIVHNFPFAIGALVRPSGNVRRTITLNSVRLPPSKTKTQIEALYLALGELLADGVADLVVEGVTYKNAYPISLAPENVVHNQYMRYQLVFGISKDQGVFRPAVKTGNGRTARFYGYGGANSSFPIFDNFEMVPAVQYAQFINERVYGEYGQKQIQYGGVRNIQLACWLVGENDSSIMHQYMADWCIDPIGRMGYLDLNGNVIENCIMTDFNSQPHVGASIRYSVNFQTGIC